MGKFRLSDVERLVFVRLAQRELKSLQLKIRQKPGFNDRVSW